jgi:hypothetical protein
MKRFHAWMALSLVTGACLGCGGKDADTTASATQGKPAATSGAIPPNEVVAMFSDSIRRGDRDMAMKLITTEGRKEIQRSGMALDPPGSADSSYKIGEVRYFDQDRDAAYVASMWIEPTQTGQPPMETEVVWAVQLEAEGWRISGLAIDQGKDQPPFLVDFENLEESMKEQSAASSPDKVAANATGQPANAQAGANSTGQVSVNAMQMSMPPDQSAQASAQSPQPGFQVPSGFQAPTAAQPSNPGGFAIPEIASPQNGQVPNQLR